MALESLQDLLMDELCDLYDAEHQILRALPEMAEAAKTRDLQQAFKEHHEQTKEHVARLDRVFKLFNEQARPKPSEGVKGIIAKGRVRTKEASEAEVRDAALISTAQRIEHYEIAAYGCARTFARVLGEQEAVSLLQQTLDEEGETDKTLTRLAEQHINPRAHAHA
ncbi:MAG TPA: ferritin-like domain-containing protein [Vicinamibacterales bacterium]|jgi:ferritin-like metal-binding protein YciE